MPRPLPVGHAMRIPRAPYREGWGVCLCITHTLLPGKGSRVAHAVRVHAAREHCPPTHTALSIIIVPFCVCTVCITGRYTVYRQPPLEYTHCVHLCTHGVSHSREECRMMTSRMSRTVVVGVVLIRAHQATDNHTTPYRPPCEIRRLPLDCHCNSGVKTDPRYRLRHRSARTQHMLSN